MNTKIGPFKHSDYYYDCDYILKDGISINAWSDKETIFIDDFNELLTKEDLKTIIAFYDDKQFKKAKAANKFNELSTWSWDIDNSLVKIGKASLAIKYRGGCGYAYGWWILEA